MGCIKSKTAHVQSSPPSPQQQQQQQQSDAEIAQNDDAPAAAAAAAIPLQEEEAPPLPSPPQPKKAKIKIYIIFYSMYGHVEALAKRMAEGVRSVDGAEAQLFRVPETLPPEVLHKMQAPPADASIPVMQHPSQLLQADAFLFGFPTRYGAMAAQMKAFFDSTSSLWKEQKLAGKAAGFFISTGTQGGGQETTAWTAITQLAHHGMLYVPVGYTFGAGMFKLDELRGGTPYGAGTFAGDGSRQASEAELQLAEHQGVYTAGIVKRLVLPSDDV